MSQNSLLWVDEQIAKNMSCAIFDKLISGTKREVNAQIQALCLDLLFHAYIGEHTAQAMSELIAYHPI